VASEGDRIAGHILFTPATIETAEGTVSGYALAPMAVLPEYQRRGIGSALVRAGVERIRGAGCPFVTVVIRRITRASGSWRHRHMASEANGTAFPMLRSWSSSSSPRLRRSLQAWRGTERNSTKPFELMTRLIEAASPVPVGNHRAPKRRRIQKVRRSSKRSVLHRYNPRANVVRMTTMVVA
jgi:GNAT superfamily N-acetyltransferase